jgi:hypothetical protein
MASGATKWDAQMLFLLEESAKGMARGAATWDAQILSLLEESAEGMARGAATRDAPMMSTLEESAKGMREQQNYESKAKWRLVQCLPNVASKKTDAYAMSSVHLSIGMHRK